MIEINEKLDKSWIISLLAEGYTTYDIVTNYEVTEDIILECKDLLDKNIIIELNLSEDFVNKAFENGYFNVEDIEKLTMSTYSNLSKDFFLKNMRYINWNKMILYISTHSDHFDEYIDIIKEKNLWQLISANDLPVNFIRKWKDKLDWTLLSMVKNFTDDEKEEFLDYIIIPNTTPKIEESKSKMSEEELDDLIGKISKLIGKW